MCSRQGGSPQSRPPIGPAIDSRPPLLTIRPVQEPSRHMTPSRDIARLLVLMAALRTRGSGCPWVLEQNFANIPPYMLELGCEVADTIVRDHFTGLRGDLADLLLEL